MLSTNEKIISSNYTHIDNGGFIIRVVQIENIDGDDVFFDYRIETVTEYYGYPSITSVINVPTGDHMLQILNSMNTVATKAEYEIQKTINKNKILKGP